MNITLYVNGDSHTAGTYKNYFSNLEDCATNKLAKKYNLDYTNHARAGGSNARIIRLTKESLEKMDPNKTVVFIGWSTFERTEWFEDNIWHQICDQPWYDVSDNLRKRWLDYVEWSLKEENYIKMALEWQNIIYQFHLWLKERNFAHRFYHGANCFEFEPKDQIEWPGNLWVGGSAYNNLNSFTGNSLQLGYAPDNYFHFNYDAHKQYADILEKPLLEMLAEVEKRQI